MYAVQPVIEAARAKECAGTNGFAILSALHLCRFFAPPEFKSKFYASAAQIAHHSGLSERALREPLRKLEEAGLVKIERPKGAARLRHDAFQYTIMPVFTGDNKIGEKPTKSAAPKRKDVPLRDGNKMGGQIADKVKSPLKGDITVESPPQPTAAAGALSAPASPGVAVKPKEKKQPDPARSEIQRQAAFKAAANREGMTVEAYMARWAGRQKAEPQSRVPAPPTVALQPEPAPATMLSIEETQRRAQAKAAQLEQDRRDTEWAWAEANKQREAKAARREA
jgi:DNA-binding transcriptional ArsR family regulator